MRTNFSHGLRLGALMLGCSIPAMAHAQDAGPPAQPQAEQYDEILVTAQRRTESLQRVPMTVNVASGEQIQELALTDFKDLQQLSPGLELTNSDGRRNVATIRGIAFEPDSGADPAIDIYFNDIAADAQTVFGAIYDVGQVEVLRGPQGIFRGRTSPGGAITLTTARADLDELEGYVQGHVTTRDAINAQGGVSFPLIPGKLAVRIAGLADFNRLGSVTRIDGRESRQETYSGRITLSFEPTDGFRGNLMYQYFHSDMTAFTALFGPGNAPYANLGDTATRTGPALSLEDRTSIGVTAPTFVNKTHFITLDTALDLTDDITWSTNFGYQHTRQQQNYPNLSTEVSVPGGYVQAVDLFLPPETLTIDSRISSDGSSRFNWMVGGYWQQFNSVSTIFDQNADTFFGLSFSPLPPSAGTTVFPGQATLDIPIRKDSYAIFGSVRYELTDSLRVEAGLRQNWFSFDQQSNFVFCGFGSCSPSFPALSANIAKRDESALTGGATLSFDWSPQVTTYLSYGHSYRPSAAQNAAPLQQVNSPDLLVSRPERSDAFEAGLRARLLDNRLTVSASAFYQVYEDYVAYLPSLNAFGGTPRVIKQIPTATNGDAVSQGFEFSFNARVTDNFDLGLSGSYVDAHYDNATVPCNLAVGGVAFIPAGQDFATCVRNDRIAQVPKFTANTTGEIRVPVGGVEPFVRWLANYRPGFQSIAEADNFYYDEIVNVNLYLGVRSEDESWEFTVFAKNLLDQARATIVSPLQLQQGTTDFVTTTAPFLSGYRSALITPPREFGLTGRFRF